MIRFSESAEQSLIGAMLLNPDLFDRIDSISPDDFYVFEHKTIWGQICKMAAAGEQIDAVTVAEALPQVELAYLGQLAANTPGSNVAGYARIIKEKSIERNLLAAANEIISAVAEECPIKDKVENAQSAVMAIGDQSASKKPRTITSVMEDVVADVQARYDGEKRTEAIGMPDLDRMVSLLNPGALNIVAARPSMGKTAFALNISEKYAKQGKTVLFCSQEMGDVSLGQRLISSVGKIPLQNIITAQMTDDDFSRMSAALGRLAQQNLIIDEQTGLTLSDIRTKARQVKRKHGLDLIVIDYLQLMGGVGDTRHEEIAAISRGLKKLAMDMHIPVIALSQLNRGLEGRTDKRPIMSDLRESGQIEQDADVILMLYRDEVYKEDSPYKGIAEVICRKNRQGRLGTIHMAFIGDYCLFDSFAGQLPRVEHKPTRRGME